MGILNFLALKITKDCGFCNIKKYKNMENWYFCKFRLFLNKKVGFTTVCALVRRESHVKGSKTYLHLLYTHIDMQICIKAALLYLSKRGQIKDGSLVPALVHFGLDGLGNPWRVGPLGILLAQQTFIRAWTLDMAVVPIKVIFRHA